MLSCFVPAVWLLLSLLPLFWVRDRPRTSSMQLFLKCWAPLGLILFSSFLAVGMIMIGVIIGSRKMGINPDNVATPIAASLGDLITLALLSGISWGLYKELGEEQQKAFVSLWSFHVLLRLPLISPSSFTLSVLGVYRMPGLEATSVSET